VARPPGYHGSFEHPIRSFLIGVVLLGLLFGGFALGTGVSKGSTASASTSVELRTVRQTRVERVTVALPGSTEILSGRRIVVPGPTRTRRIWVQVPDHGPVAPVLGVVRSLMDPSRTAQSTGSTPPVTVIQPVTITTTVTTTVPVTTTVTETGTDSGSTGDQTAGS
jgi:hypothetical protein